MASELRVNTLKDASGNNSVATSVVASGSAKASLNYKGTATNSVRYSFNVSSVTDKVHFASVCFYHPDQKNNEDVLPLYRGHGTGMKFSGLSLIN